MAKMPTVRFDAGEMFRLVKRLALAGVLLVVIGIVSCSTTMRVDAAHVGIRVKLAGSSRGVDDIPVVTGWVFYNPLTEQIIQFPTSVQNVVWTASPHEGRTVDESITFSSSEGVNVGADIGMSFHIESKMAPHIYLRFREPDLLKLADGYMRNAVREAFNRVASTMQVQDIYGAGKTKLIQDVSKELQDVLGKDGFIIDQLTINGALRLPENVAQAINQAMEATQKAIQAENRVRQVRAEAEQSIAQAHGAAESARERAKGEADALLIKAKAEARANTIIQLSTTAMVLQYRALERWDGKLPTMNNGQLPMLTFDVSKASLNAETAKRLKELLDEPMPSQPGSSSGATTDAAEKPSEPAKPAEPPKAPAAPAPAPPPSPTTGF